eukprot:4236053-Pleurochrysis_carterae.AAC.2
MQEKPTQFLDMNINICASGQVKVSTLAYIKAKAEYYLPPPVAEYPKYDTPASPQLVKDCEEAARKEHTVDPVLQQKKYQSEVGALIYARPCGGNGRARQQSARLHGANCRGGGRVQERRRTAARRVLGQRLGRRPLDDGLLHHVWRRRGLLRLEETTLHISIFYRSGDRGRLAHCS